MKADGLMIKCMGKGSSPTAQELYSKADITMGDLLISEYWNFSCQTRSMKVISWILPLMAMGK
jgi:hypothetical protein